MNEKEEKAFTPDELAVLRTAVAGYLGDGFETPPYSDAMYRVIEKLGIEQEGIPYSLTRVSSQ